MKNAEIRLKADICISGSNGRRYRTYGDNAFSRTLVTFDKGTTRLYYAVQDDAQSSPSGEAAVRHAACRRGFDTRILRRPRRFILLPHFMRDDAAQARGMPRPAKRPRQQRLFLRFTMMRLGIDKAPSPYRNAARRAISFHFATCCHRDEYFLDKAREGMKHYGRILSPGRQKHRSPLLTSIDARAISRRSAPSPMTPGFNACFWQRIFMSRCRMPKR